jgi:branched-chain amino acid transport system substrate-binding protein
MWSISISQLDNAPRLAGFAVNDLGLKQLAVFHLNTDYGRTTYDLFDKAVQQVGGAIVSRQPYLPEDKDFRAAITEVKAAGADGIVLISYYNDAALITQQVRQQGLSIPIVGDAGTVSPEFLKLAGPAAEGYYTTSEFFPSDPDPLVQAFVTAYRAKYNGEDPDLFAAIAYDAIKIMSVVMQQHGTERAQIKAGLAAVKDVPSIMYGKVTFRDDRRVANPKLIRLVIKDGKYTVWER